MTDSASAAVYIDLFNQLLHIVGLVVISLVGVAVQRYVKDKNARDAISAALANGVGLALDKGQQAGDQFLQNASVKSVAVKTMLDYVKDQVPQALAHFGQTDQDLAAKATAAIAKALALATPIPDATPSAVQDVAVVPAPTPVAEPAADAPPASSPVIVKPGVPPTPIPVVTWGSPDAAATN